MKVIVVFDFPDVVDVDSDHADNVIDELTIDLVIESVIELMIE
jgi:hypothetical protein